MSGFPQFQMEVCQGLKKFLITHKKLTGYTQKIVYNSIEV